MKDSLYDMLHDMYWSLREGKALNYSTQILCSISVISWVTLGWENYIMKLQERKQKAGESDQESEM